MDVIWFVQGEDTEIRGHVKNATDFLQSLKLVDRITLNQVDYRVVETELVAGEEPYLAVLLDEE